MVVPLYRSRGCFGCGRENPLSLGLAPERDGGQVRARFTARPEHRGYAQALHGGLVCTLLDEICGLACSQRADEKCATVSIEVALRAPVRIGIEVVIEARCVARRGRALYSHGRVVEAASGRELATARVKCVVLAAEQRARFVAAD